MIVVDTSVLVDLFRGHDTLAAARLQQLEIDAVPFAIPAICCQEILQGARDAREWSVLESYLETQHVLWPADPWASHLGAARIYFDCRRRGITIGSSIDCLIAQLALEHGAGLLHDDDDFDRIRRVRPLRTLRA